MKRLLLGTILFSTLAAQAAEPYKCYGSVRISDDSVKNDVVTMELGRENLKAEASIHGYTFVVQNANETLALGIYSNATNDAIETISATPKKGKSTAKLTYGNLNEFRYRADLTCYEQ